MKPNFLLRSTFFYLIFFGQLSNSLLCQQMVVDINITKPGSSPVGLQSGTNSFVFLAKSQDYGFEMFLSDGTVAGTQLLFDAEPGATDGRYAAHTVIGDDVYLITYDINYVRYIWKINLTIKTPVLLQSTSTNAGYSLGIEDFFVKMGNKVFFSVRNTNSMFELWKTDGTANGTEVVTQLSVNAFPEQYTVVNDLLFFTMKDDIHGREVWRTDGTMLGTFMVKDIDLGNLGFGVYSLTAYNGKVYFIATEEMWTYELWSSDGTETGTEKFIFSPNSTIVYTNELEVMGDKLFISASVNAQTGTELWKTDGTTQNTTLVKDINLGSLSGNPTSLKAADGKLYFLADNGVQGQELWISDGTDTGTYMIADLRMGMESAYWQSTLIGTYVGNTYYFLADDGVHGKELWKTTGGQGDVDLLKDVLMGINSSEITRIIGFNNAAYFSALDAPNGREIYSSDGTTQGTQLFVAINSSGNKYSSPNQLRVFNDKLVFSADNGISGYEPWVSDGTANGTAILKDVYPGLTSSNFIFSAELSSNLFFLAENPTFGYEIWKTDATSNGTTLLKDINPGTSGGSTERIVALGNKIVFNAYRPDEGEELWISDGTETGTTLLKDIDPNGQTLPFLLDDAFSFNGQPVALFEASLASEGTALWKTDGTLSGTEKLKVFSNFDVFTLSDAVQLGNKVLFGAGYFDNELYATDGTPNGTSLLKDINLGFNGSYPTDLVKFKDKIFFSANDGINGRELWSTDGTPNSTILLKDITPGLSSSYPSSFFNFDNNLLFFTANSDGFNDAELWVTDGTEIGTRLVMDINPGTEPSYPRNFAQYSSKIYFSANDGEHGHEFWQTDGTTTGTKLVKDINPGLASSDPESMVLYKNALFFAADDGFLGRELWRFPAEGVIYTNEPSDVNIEIYPNPANETIKIKGLAQESQINILDLNGRIIHTEFIENDEKVIDLNLINYPSGIYLASIRNKSNDKISNLRFVKI
jgi:ELWxxDGT repeat protein